MTHDIAKIDNYSVYRRLGNNLDYTTNKHEVTLLLPRGAVNDLMHYFTRPYASCYSAPGRPLYRGVKV